MDYVDGFVAAVPIANKSAYIEHARQFADVFKEYGATRVVECWGDDVPPGEKTSFLSAVQCEEGEAVVFSWVIWPTKAVRDAGMARMEQDERMSSENNPMPFDGSRLIYGGFEMVVDE